MDERTCVRNLRFGNHRSLPFARIIVFNAVVYNQRAPHEAPEAMRMTTATESLKVIKDPSTLRELTAERLREGILTMHFRPNQRLVERDLCEQTGVSRTSVREALRHL